MKEFQTFLNKIENINHKELMNTVLSWVHQQFPDLEMAVKWNQPMFLDHGTFIIAFSIAKGHFSLTPEAYGMGIFQEKAQKLGYQTTKMLIKIKWDDNIDFDFIDEIIRFNIEDKKECETFWRQ